MSYEEFKNSVLYAVQSSNSMKCFQEFEKFPMYSNRLNEIIMKKNGDTIVHLASQSGCLDVIKYVNEKGNTRLLVQKNLDGKSPLHVAAHFGQLNCVEYLLSCNVPVDPLKRADWTPLMLACTKQNAAIVKLLLEHGANPMCKNKDGWTAFHIAAREGSVDIINCLLSKCCLAWKTKSNNGRTPLHTACLHGHLDAVKIITRNIDCNKDVQDCCGLTPLMDAVSANHLPVVKFLIEDMKVSAVKTDVLGRNILHFAAQSGSLCCIEYLILKCNLYIDAKTTDGLTALHFAAKENNVDCVQLLLNLKADSSIKDSKGRFALQYASTEEVQNLFSVT